MLLARVRFGLACGGLLLLTATGADEVVAQGAPPEIVFTSLADQVDLVEVRSPSGLIGANLVAFHQGGELLLVDANLPVPPLAGYLERTILNRYSADSISWLVVTHWHPDHSGGIGMLGQRATVLAQARTREILSRPQEGHGLGRVGQTSNFPAREPSGLPGETFEASGEFRVGDATIAVAHAPASHTAGDAVVRLPGDVIALGDLVWPGAFPFVDYHNGGSALGLLAALERLHAEAGPETVFVPGHGAPFGRAELAEYLVMVRGTIAAVVEAKKEGLSLDQTQGRGLARWQDWASSLVPEEVWIEMIWHSEEPAEA